MDFGDLHVVRPIIGDKKQSAFDLTFTALSVDFGWDSRVDQEGGGIVDALNAKGIRGKFIRHPNV
jgi:hypothetical protein